MELKINEIAIPDQIVWNFEELKTELAEKAREYEITIYSEDQIKEAKADRAALKHDYAVPNAFRAFEDAVAQRLGRF